MNDDQQASAEENFEPAVEVQAPHQNGTATAAPVSPSKMQQVIRTEKTVFERPLNSDILMNSTNIRKPYQKEPQKVKDDRDALDELMVKPDAMDWFLSVHRYQPSHTKDGVALPMGRLPGSVPIMPYDALVDEIVNSWGGGSYRVHVVDNRGQVVDAAPRAFLVGIPTNVYPPKVEQYEKTEGAKRLPSDAPGIISSSTESEDLKAERKRVKEQIELNNLKAREEEAQFQVLEAEWRREQRRKQLADLRQDSMGGGDKKLAAIEAKLAEEKRQREQDRKDDLARADADRRMFMEGLSKLAEAVKVPPPVKDDSMKEMFLAMSQQTTAILSAMINQPKPVPPADNTKEFFLEMHKASVEANRNSTQLLTAVLQKPKEDGNAPMVDMAFKMMAKDNSASTSLINNLFTMLQNKKSELTYDVIRKIQEEGEARMERMMGLMQGNAAADAEQSSDPDYDPKLGFLGNAGKALFSGLKGLVEASVQNPAVLEIIAKLVGNKAPTDQQLADAARRMESQQTGMPAMGYQQPALPGYSPINQMAPYPPQPTQPQQVQRPAGPPPLRPQQPATVQQAPVQATPNAQQQMANDLEGEAGGLPSNADPEPVPTAEEMAERNLFDQVTDTVEMMIGECTGRPDKREWPEHATQTWNKDFIAQIVATPSDAMRMQLMQSRCDPAKWEMLRNIVLAQTPIGAAELARLWQEMHRFVDMNHQPVSSPQPSPAPVPEPVVSAENPPVQG